ncbi:hypothetical protein [Mucilaginibacter psychrotolerans]|uniref:Uncharacterized protein n=1 Tax=Mucilaginibacter psychrotolerans TaxID=1524096 RepID=A0A4Y8SI50_9SPHI|nr:hypothetical protein [Mucilaginibacter psychrotolerans]TFF38773.1 hypothetical protein E2R66_07140 [Mucilaginibacter psychrotolerans]
MFSFLKRKKQPEVPNWASFFKPDEYTSFLKEIEKYFYDKNITYIMGDGEIVAGPNDFEFDRLGLVNVAQMCKFDEDRTYSQVVNDHFETMIRANKFDKEFRKVIGNYEEVKQYLAVRLYDEVYFSAVGKENTIGKHFVANIYMALVFDLPDGISSITPEQGQEWDQGFEELIATGISNVKANCPISTFQEDFDGTIIWLAEGDHFFTGNIVFHLENYPQLIGAHGSLIGIPHRHGAIIYPINDIDVVNAINKLIPLINGMNQEGPGSISNSLLWYTNQGFEDLPYKIEDNTIQFYPTDKFTAMLSFLAGE